MSRDVEAALAALKKKATKKTRDGLVRYGIPNDNAWGVAVSDIKAIAKKLGKDHALASALWKQDVYEARMLAVFVADPEALTVAEMDRWARSFDSWALADTACFHLFDRSPHAFGRVRAWAGAKPEHTKRAAFALLASLALHGRAKDDGAYLACLPLCARGARDGRNFVDKGVLWALNALGRRASLRKAVREVAEALAAEEAPGPRAIGRAALRELRKPAR